MTVTRPSRDGELGTSPLMDYVFEHPQRWPDKSAVTDGATTVTRTYREQAPTGSRLPRRVERPLGWPRMVGPRPPPPV